MKIQSLAEYRGTLYMSERRWLHHRLLQLMSSRRSVSATTCSTTLPMLSNMTTRRLVRKIS